MVDSERLKKRVKAAGYSQFRLAERMQMHSNTLYNKMNNRNEFTLGEVTQMCELIGMEDPKEICETFMRKGKNKAAMSGTNTHDDNAAFFPKKPRGLAR